MKKLLLPGLKAMIIEMGSKAVNEAVPVTLDWISLREHKLALIKQAYEEQVALREARERSDHVTSISQNVGQVPEVDE